MKDLNELELEFKDEIIKIAKDILEKNIKPMIEIKVSDEKPTLFQSKFGGVPYLPKDREVPTTDYDEQLTFLAQINIEELPENDIYPMKEGMLQFWILNNDVYGLSFDERYDDGYKVVYYKEIDKSVTEDEVLEKYQPFEEEDDYFPLGDEEFSLEFNLTDGYCTESDERFEKMFTKEMEKFSQERGEEYQEVIKKYTKREGELNFWSVYDILEENDEIEEKLFKAGHKIGGYPNYTQSDVRGEEYDVLLLQIDSEGTDSQEIMWGDCGIANFFISKKDLEELNFENVLYNWDCC